MSDTLIRVEGVSKKFCRSLKRSLWYGMQDLGRELLGKRHGGDGDLRKDEFWAIKDVSFEVKRGECLGLIGHNGAGKTTLLRMINGLLKPDRGTITLAGRTNALIALGAGFNPTLTGRENIYVNGAILGLSKREIDTHFDQIVDFSELGEFIDSPVQSYSSGMTVRLGFSIATALNPDILLMDEILAVGDMNFQAKCFNRVAELRTHGVACILVTHNMHHAARFCDSGLSLKRNAHLKKESIQQAIADHLSSKIKASTSEVESIYTNSNYPVSFHPAFSADNHRNRCTHFQAGNSIFIEIPYTSPESIPIPIIEIILRLDDGTPFLYFTNRESEYREGSIFGSGKISAKFAETPGNNVWLNLSIAAWDPETGELAHWQKSIARIFIQGNAESIALIQTACTLSITSCE